MARILMAWELGGGLGHLVPLAALAAPLLDAGHRVDLALRDLADAPAVLGRLADAPGLRLWPAPVWLRPLQGAAPATGHAELLLRAGWLHPAALRGLFRGWRSLLDATDPDLLIADHAPTALLAARGRPGLRRVTVGSGFFQPPPLRPLPPWRAEPGVDPARLARAEAAVLATADRLLHEAGQPPLPALHALTTDVDETWLLTWPELDVLQRAPGTPGCIYAGPVAGAGGGMAPVWPPGDGPALFAYLKADYAALDAVLKTLAGAPWRSLLHLAGATAAQRAALAASPRVALADGPVDINAALARADAVLCHAGAGTLHAALQAGRPAVLLPMQSEQRLLAERATALGVARWLTPADVPRALRAALQRALEVDGPLRTAARGVAAAHSNDEPAALRLAARALRGLPRGG